MLVTGWKNGKHGGDLVSYGLGVKVLDRDRYFKRVWGNVVLNLERFEIEVIVNIYKASFWSGNCQELINKDIKIWMQNNDLIPWPDGSPPKFEMTHIRGNEFRVEFTYPSSDR